MSGESLVRDARPRRARITRRESRGLSRGVLSVDALGEDRVTTRDEHDETSTSGEFYTHAAQVWRATHVDTLTLATWYAETRHR